MTVLQDGQGPTTPAKVLGTVRLMPQAGHRNEIESFAIRSCSKINQILQARQCFRLVNNHLELSSPSEFMDSAAVRCTKIGNNPMIYLLNAAKIVSMSQKSLIPQGQYRLSVRPHQPFVKEEQKDPVERPIERKQERPISPFRVPNSPERWVEAIGNSFSPNQLGSKRSEDRFYQEAVRK